MALPRRVLWYGKDAPLPEARELRAGPLTMLLEEGGLRYVRLGSVEVLRQVYGAVRDRNWNTVPAEVSNLRVRQGESSCDASFDVRCRQGDVDFAWRGAIRGSADGTVVFRFEGEAGSTFLRNRIGLCVLHPVECAARPCRVAHSDGSVEEGVFPRLVSPHQPFKDIRAISHPVAAGCEAEVRFEGEVFEMEDQRNWTDASFKTYSTPLALPFPVEVKAGTRIVQTVTLALKGRVPKLAPPPKDVVLTVGRPTWGEPFFDGLGLGVSEVAPSPRQAARLSALALRHLRVDVDLADPGWEGRIERAAAQALAAETRLLVGFRPAPEPTLRRLAERIASHGAAACRFVVLDPASEAEAGQGAWLGHVCNPDLGWLHAGGGVGTRAYFAELNRGPWMSLGWSGVPLAYSINPQVHGSDLRTLVESLAGQGEVARSAGDRGGAMGQIPGPVTLKPRFNPNATAAEAEPEGALPSSVDERQMSLFGAGWTVGSLKHLLACVASPTYYETVGWRGVMEAESGAPLPARFPSVPGAVFPLYHVFADLANLPGGRVLSAASNDPLRAEILAIRRDDRLRVLAANFTPELLRVRLAGLPDRLRLRRLNETNAERAMTSPEEYRGEPPDLLNGEILELLPFEVARLDA